MILEHDTVDCLLELFLHESGETKKCEDGDHT